MCESISVFDFFRESNLFKNSSGSGLVFIFRFDDFYYKFILTWRRLLFRH